MTTPRLNAQAVLAPADVQPHRTAKGRAPLPGQPRGLTGALWAAFRVLDRQGIVGPKTLELAQRTAQRAIEVSASFRLPFWQPADGPFRPP
jgi:hypothetical protein